MTESLFEQNQPEPRRTTKVLFSICAHGVILGLLVLIPLIYTEALPMTQMRDYLLTPSPPTAPAPRPPRAVRIVSVEHRTISRETAQFVAPGEIPRTIPRIVDEAPPAGSPTDIRPGIDGALPGDGSDSQFMQMLRKSLPAPPRPTPKASEAGTAQRIRLVSSLSQANLIYAPQPEYPPLAKTAGIQGPVVLEAIISKDGTVAGLHVLSGHPLLVDAAVRAVLQWRYRPTILNGVPVEVSTTITVNFRLH
ncbi:MAG: energy transducer TonB [Acidobacteriia bacterium]|nr:energy transducer TonB [Terriglobia bacterium]